MNTFDKAVAEETGELLRSDSIKTIQVNLGLRCNLSCRHCHLQAGPGRNEMMSWETMEAVLALARCLPDVLVDITGGAPELHPSLVPFIEALSGSGHPVQVRTNLTVLQEPEMASLPAFFKEHRIELVASLPCYLDANVTAQRGAGAFERSIASLRRLNGLGYGRDLPLSLVYNPGGAFLPPLQSALEEAYRRELRERHGVVFTRLLTITNMPLGRFLDDLRHEGKDDTYRDLLREAFNPCTVDGLMCRQQICIGWDGRLFDCDFNQALGLSLGEGLPKHVAELDPDILTNRPIVTGEHCFGCTAGAGSSCGGALVA